MQPGVWGRSPQQAVTGGTCRRCELASIFGGMCHRAKAGAKACTYYYYANIILYHLNIEDPRKPPQMPLPQQNLNVRIILVILTPKMCGFGYRHEFRPSNVRTFVPASEIGKKIEKMIEKKTFKLLYTFQCPQTRKNQ